MRTKVGENGFSRRSATTYARALVAAGLLLCAVRGLAQPNPPSGKSSPINPPLDSWSFRDQTNWTSDLGYAPVSFTNLTALSWFGDGSSLGLATNVPAWLQYNVTENDGTTNLTVDQGSVVFWFAPAWAGTNEGGTGPGQWGRLIEVGGYTSDASYGWWSLYVDDVGANLYFTVQPGDSSTTTYLTAAIDWTSNYWHCIALTYSATNTALYLDGVLATNGPGLTCWPGTNVLAGGFYIGSDSNGVIQAQGAFDDLYTYNVPLDGETVHELYNSFWANYYLVPWNMMACIGSAPSNPSTNAGTPNVITGPGYLLWLGSSGNYVTSSNVWFTNVFYTTTAQGPAVAFTMAGGQADAYYDVFATAGLTATLTNATWVWCGQGLSCNIYAIPMASLGSASACFILGTPLDSDGDGLTDAYELLVSKTDPNNAYSNLDGLLDGWDVLLGLNPHVNNVAQSRANYSYTLADWLNGVSGVKSGTISLDNEGNVTQVSK